MGKLDFLKGIIPEKLINIEIDNRKIDNRKIILTDNSIKIGRDEIRDKQLIDRIFSKIEIYRDDSVLPFQVLHKDIVGSYEE